MDVSCNIDLEDLACGDNPLTVLDVRTNTQLKSIECMGAELRSLDVSCNGQLKELMCSFNRLSNLNLQNNSKLEKLWISGNRFTTLNVSACPDINNINCSNNKLAGEGMEAFIQSIPPCTFDDGGKLVVINTDTNIADKNVCTAAQINAVKIKNWTVYSYGGYFEGEKIYESSDAETAESRNMIQPH